MHSQFDDLMNHQVFKMNGLLARLPTTFHRLRRDSTRRAEMCNISRIIRDIGRMKCVRIYEVEEGFTTS